MMTRDSSMDCHIPCKMEAASVSTCTIAAPTLHSAMERWTLEILILSHQSMTVVQHWTSVDAKAVCPIVSRRRLSTTPTEGYCAFSESPNMLNMDMIHLTPPSHLFARLPKSVYHGSSQTVDQLDASRDFTLYGHTVGPTVGYELLATVHELASW
jgi:hypothetical protein